METSLVEMCNHTQCVEEHFALVARNSLFARSIIISKAPKKEPKKGAPVQQIPPSSDVVNIFKDKEDPRIYSLRCYPPFLKDLLNAEDPALILPRSIGEGHGLNFKDQWRLMQYMRRYKNQQKLLYKTGNDYDETPA